MKIPWPEWRPSFFENEPTNKTRFGYTTITGEGENQFRWLVMTANPAPNDELAAIVERNRSLWYKDHRLCLLNRYVSPDGNHTVHLIWFWNGYIQCTAIAIDADVRDWCTGISNLEFSQDGQCVTYDRFVAEDPTLEGVPGGQDRTEKHTLKLQIGSPSK